MGWMDYAGVALGAASIYEGYQASGDAADSAASQAMISQVQLTDAQAAQDRHNEIYGSLEENLAGYYEELTPKAREEQGLVRYEGEFMRAKDSVVSSMAQRGLTGSGIEGEALNTMEMQAASDRALIGEQAEQDVRSEQLGFLGVGLGQGEIAQQNVASASQTMANVYGSQSSTAAAEAANAASAAGNVYRALNYKEGYDPSTMW